MQLKTLVMCVVNRNTTKLKFHRFFAATAHVHFPGEWWF